MFDSSISKLFYNNLDSFFWIKLNILFKYNLKLNLTLFNYVFFDKYVLKNNISKLKYIGRSFFGLYYGRSSLNRFYSRKDLRPYNLLYLNSFNFNMKNYFYKNQNYSNFKGYLRKPLL